MLDESPDPPPPAPPALPGPARPTPVAEILALAPEALAERLSALRTDVERAYAANTKRMWRASWRVWCSFCATADPAWPVLPATVDSLRAFLNARISGKNKKKRATLEGYLATLALVHRLVGMPWPLHEIEGKLMWRGICKSFLDERQHQKDGLTIEHIARMLAPLDTTLPRDARDAAMLLVAYETQLRRSNVVGLDLEHLTFDSDGTTAVLIKRSKEDQLGKGRIRNLSIETTKRLRHWIALARITEGPVFRSLPHAAKADRFAQKRLSDRDVARIFKRRAAAVGLSSTEIAGHSTRIGAAQDMLAAGLSGAEIMREVGWRTERQLFRYTERLESKRGAMAKFLKLRAQKALPPPEAKEEESG